MNNNNGDNPTNITYNLFWIESVYVCKAMVHYIIQPTNQAYNQHSCLSWSMQILDSRL